MESKTARASAVKEPKKVVVELTPEQCVKEVRSLVSAGLFVGNMRWIAGVLAAHDALAEKLESAQDQVTRIEAENIDLRLELKQTVEAYQDAGKAMAAALPLVDKVAGELFGQTEVIS